MDYSRLNITKLKEQLKERNIDGRSKLTTKDAIISVLKLHDNQPDNKEAIRKLIVSLLKSNEHCVKPVIDVGLVEPQSQISSRFTPKIAASFEELEEQTPEIDITKNIPDLLPNVESIDLTSDELVAHSKFLNSSWTEKIVKKEEQIYSKQVETETRERSKTVCLEMPKSDYDRLCKIVANYEKSRIKTRENAQKKSEKEREEKNLMFIQRGLNEYVKVSKQREPTIKQLTLEDYVVSRESFNK